MRRVPRPVLLGGAAAVAATAAVVLGIAAYGILLRAEDPLRNPVMAAEDPYTHMVLVKEHVRDGSLEPRGAGGALYPPGFHAVTAALWVYSGLDLYDLLRFLPVALGGLAVVAIAVLAGRWDGPLAAVVAGLAIAVMPEHIARTTMASPISLVLVLLPFLALSLLEVLCGRLAWLAVAGPIAAFLVVLHPWTLGFVALAAAATLLLVAAFPWDPARHPPATRAGAAAVAAVVSAAFAAALASRWAEDGTSFSTLLAPVAGAGSWPLVALSLAVALVGVGILAALARRGSDKPLRSGPASRAGQVVGTLALAALLAAIIVPAMQQGLPQFVNPPRMLGWPVIGLAVLGLLAVPRAGSPVAHAGAGILLAALPMVFLNPLDRGFLPHRTVVLLGLGAALLAGVAATRIAAVVAQHPALRPRPGARPGHPRVLPAAAGATLLTALAVGAVVVAATPDPYEGGWYRTYEPCEFDALRRVADEASRHPGALVVTGSWQGQLVIAALAGEPRQVWFKPELFTSAAEQEAFVRWRGREPAPTYVVVERHLSASMPDARLGFLERPPFELLEGACAGAPWPARAVRVHAIEGGGGP